MVVIKNGVHVGVPLIPSQKLRREALSAKLKQETKRVGKERGNTEDEEERSEIELYPGSQRLLIGSAAAFVLYLLKNVQIVFVDDDY